jgi:cell division protein FtsW (lipid II flippase)
MPTDEQNYQQELEQDRARQRLLDEEGTEKLADQDQENHKMGWGLFSIAFILSAFADIVEFLTVGTLGWFVGLIVDLILLAMLGSSKAGQQQWKKWIWGPIIETIPVLSAVPFRIAFLIWAFVASRSEKLQKIQGVVEFGSKGKVKSSL